MEKKKPQLKFPLDPVSQSIIERLILDYNTYGFIAPSYTTSDRDNLTPIQGMVIFNTTTSKLNFYTGSAWEAITSA